MATNIGPCLALARTARSFEHAPPMESPRERVYRLHVRLFRGLQEPHRPERVGERQPGPWVGTDFTDCPFTALLYARGRRGVLLVVDVPEQGLRVSEEYWHGVGAKRLMVWGKFERFIVAMIPAKELRAHVRKKGVVTTTEAFKSELLKRVVAEWISGRPTA